MKNSNIRLNFIKRATIVFASLVFIAINNYAGETPSSKNIVKLNNNNTEQIIESWKTKVSEWALIDMQNLFDEDIEENIELEKWMLSADDKFWTSAENYVEDDIELEEWMMDLSSWK